MISVKNLLEDIDIYKQRFKTDQEALNLIEQIEKDDSLLKDYQKKLDTLRQQKNEFNKLFINLNGDEKEEKLKEMKIVSEKIKTSQAQAVEIKNQIESLTLKIAELFFEKKDTAQSNNFDDSKKSIAYVYQIDKWQKFWLKTKDINHKIKQFETNNFVTKIYEYPWILGQKIWFIPSSPVGLKDVFEDSQKQKVLNEFLDFLKELKKEAKRNKISILKFYLEPRLGDFLAVHNQLELLKFLQNYDSNFWVKGRRGFMYQQIMQINTLDLKLPRESFSLNNDYLNNFFNINKNFWLKRAYITRSNTKKSLKSNWIIDNKKNNQNLDLNYQVLLQTAERHGFVLPSKKYFQELANQNFSYFWLLKNQNEEVVSSWIGLNLGDRLVNLYGGNRSASFVNFGPSYLHLAGMCFAKHLGCKYYDFGGYNKDETTAKFKDGYKGEILSFPGNLNLGINFLGKILSRFC